MTGGLPAVASLVRIARDGEGAAAVEGAVERDHALLQRHGDGDGLEGAARLVHVLHGLVMPLGLLRLGEKAAADDIVRGLRHLLLHLLADGLKVVQVEIVQRGEGKDLPRVHVHGDGRRAPPHAVILHGLLQMLLHDVLDRGVDGQRHVIAVFGVVVILIFRVEHVGAEGVLCPDHASGSAGQHAVHAQLDAAQSRVLIAHEAHDVAGQAAVGIIALGVGLELDPLEVVLVFELPYPGTEILLYLAGHGLVPALRVRGHVQNLRVVHTEDLGEAPRDQRRVLVVHHDLRRGDVDGVHRGAHGQDIAVAVVDRAAAAVDRGLAHLLLDGGDLVLLVLQDLDLIELSDQHDKCSNAAHKQKHQCAAEHSFVGGASTGRCGIAVCHGSPPRLVRDRLKTS